MEHELVLVNGVSKYKCDICGTMMADEKEFHTHRTEQCEVISQFEGEIISYQCRVCMKQRYSQGGDQKRINCPPFVTPQKPTHNSKGEKKCS